MRASRAASSPACSTAAASSSRLRPGLAASSSSPRSTANGVRSSWLASATSARCRASAPCSRPSSSFMVVARAAISSRVRGTWRPGAGSRAETEATSRLSRSTGDRAARASPYPPSPAAATNTTPAMSSSRVTSWRVRSNASRSTPATATHPGCRASGPAMTRSCSSSSRRVSTNEWWRAWRIWAGPSSGLVPASGLPPRTRPAGSMTWTTYSPGAGLPASRDGRPGAPLAAG